MKINLLYNDFKKEIDIDISVKNGILQENILSYCLLMIYNIEYSAIRINNNNSYILGSDQLLFEDTLESSLSKEDLNIIEEIIIYDRKRDEFDNVIKENYIIDRYNKWYQIYENENYINYMNQPQNIFQNMNQFQSIFQNMNQIQNMNHLQNMNQIQSMNHLQNINQGESKEELQEIEENNSQHELSPNITIDNRNIIRFPLTSILGNILRIPEETNISEEPAIHSNNENLIKNLIEDLLKNDTEPNNIEETSAANILPPHNNESMNNIINIFDNYLHNYMNENYNSSPQYVNIFNSNIIRDFNNLSSTNIFDEYADLPELVEDNVYQEDVKIVLNEEQFDNLSNIIYDELNQESNECLICMDEFKRDDNIIKTSCNHLFHKKCIKTWLCGESNKCPICRIEIEKGMPK
jgi:hypothetical protein